MNKRPSAAFVAAVAAVLALALVAGCTVGVDGAGTRALLPAQTTTPLLTPPLPTPAPSVRTPPTSTSPAASTPSTVPARTAPGSLAGSAPPRPSGTGPDDPADPDGPRRPTVADVTIDGALTEGVDLVARAAISDIVTYWRTAAPDVFGSELTDLRGGYHSVDPDAAATAPCLSDPADVRGNAFYCPRADAIVYDRVYLTRIAADYSDLDVALTLAHEFGHALQSRFPTGATKSIAVETQADCYAGAWAKWVGNGQAAHFAFSADDLDRVLGDYVWEMGDPAGSDPDHDQAHGSAFDRVTAVQEGYLDGAAACVADYADGRRFVAQKFTADSRSADGKGNLSLSDAISAGAELLARFWSADQATAGLPAPRIRVDDPGCTGDRYIAVCPRADGIGISPSASVQVYHDRIGDFATVTALSLAYAQYEGLLDETPLSPVERICLTGAFAASLLTGPESVLSPGDLDEAVQVLLVAGPANALVDTGDVSAWDRLDAFRAGVFGGRSGCG